MASYRGHRRGGAFAFVAPLAIEAAMETGLPVWLGVSCKLHPESGEVVSFGPQSIPFGRLLDRLLETPPAVCANEIEIRAHMWPATHIHFRACAN